MNKGLNKAQKKVRQVKTDGLFGDPAGARTQDPILKRDMLYLLSYGILIIASPVVGQTVIAGANIEGLFYSARPFQKKESFFFIRSSQNSDLAIFST